MGSFEMIGTRRDIVSDCCGATIYDDSDICSCCKEHCGGTEECPLCDGTGEVDTVVKESFASPRISPRHIKTKCEGCNGEGWIEADLF